VVPRRLSIAREGDRLSVEVNGCAEGCRVSLCDRAGNVLASTPVEDQRASLAIGGSAGEPACVKLYRNDLLLDVAPLAAARHMPG